MKPSLVAALSALAICAGVPGATQEHNIEITAEQRERIRDYVVLKRMRPIAVGKVEVGSPLADGVDTVQVPDSWGSSLRKYRYVYSGDHLILVEPRTREVVRMID